MTTGPLPDAYARLLGIEVSRDAPDQVTAEATIGDEHLNPHGTAHGAFIYTLGGVALAAIASDDARSGIISAVHIDYLRPARNGDRLVATATLAERLDREDVYTVRVVAAVDDRIVARLTARAATRIRQI